MEAARQQDGSSMGSSTAAAWAAERQQYGQQHGSSMTSKTAAAWPAAWAAAATTTTPDHVNGEQ